MPNKGFRFRVKQLNDEGTFEGLASVYDVEDLLGDVVDKGAFTKTLRASGPQRPLLWQHRDPVGTCTVTDTGSALALKGKLSLGLQAGRDAYTLLQDQVVEGLSIGFETLKEAYVDGVRHLTEIKLWEVSLVTFPANPLATVSDVKAHQANQQAAISRALREFKSDILSALER